MFLFQSAKVDSTEQVADDIAKKVFKQQKADDDRKYNLIYKGYHLEVSIKISKSRTQADAKELLLIVKL